MKRLPLFKQMVMACGFAVAATFVSSCSTPSPAARAEQLTAAAPVARIYSHNEVNNPYNRDCFEAGPLPENTARALAIWLKESTPKNFTYANPQYYVTLPTANGKSTRVWGICSDGHGNMVGMLIPRDGVAAWDLPSIGSYKVYVCDTIQRKALSDTIMEALADAKYDEHRISFLKASGLTEEEDKRYLISKPLTEQEKQRLEEQRKREEAAAKEAAKAEEDASSPADDLETTEDDEDAETATPMSDADVDDIPDSSDDEESSSDDEDDSSSDDEEEDE